MAKIEISRRFKRPVSSKNFIPEIDGLRFFAIFTVFLLHLNNYVGRSLNYDYYEGVRDVNSWSWFINRSGLGVEVFFAISGFIISLPFLKHYVLLSKKPSISTYFYRRLTRLEIPFLISCILFYIGYLYSYDKDFGKEIGHFFATITYTHEFFYGKWAPFNPVTWSLEVEIQFYIVAPLLLKLIFKPKSEIISFLIFLFFLSVPLIFRQYFYELLKSYHLHMSILIFLPYFLIGIVVAFLYIKYPSFFKKKNIIWDIIGVSSIYSLFYFAWRANQSYFCLSLFLFFISTFKGVLLNKIFNIKGIFLVGGMCYTLYLLHYPLIHFFGSFTLKIINSNNFITSYIFQLILISPFILGSCICYYLLIEKPCMDKNWPNKLHNKIKKCLNIKR
ncbi:MAG: acyltransferase [Massilibacteroides sp.]|nr:acyltransferase [Massilibacteroides sp.]